VRKMLCCIGLFGGYILGSMLGGPWALIAPALGFGAGLMGDIKLMRSGYGGGCHGGEGHAHGKNVKKEAKDPVCGMDVEATDYKAEFDGKTYYFCSSECKSAFLKNPKMYVK
jgi:YHS domain-containing protein